MTSEVIDRLHWPRITARIVKDKEDAMLLSLVSLRAALLLDAGASGITAALMIAGAGLLEGPLGLPAWLLREAGLILVPYVAMVTLIATRARIAPSAVYVVIVCNALWTVGSFALLASGFVTPSALGTAFVIVQALAVAGLGALQYVALHRPQPAAA